MIVGAEAWDSLSTGLIGTYLPTQLVSITLWKPKSRHYARTIKDWTRIFFLGFGLHHDSGLPVENLLSNASFELQRWSDS